MIRSDVRCYLCAIACACVLSARPEAAFAEGADEARARALFGQGRQLADAGQYAAACPAFEAASGLFESAGVLVNLGDCYEKIGRTASAWTAFARAAEVASRTDRPQEAAEAKRRQAVLTPRLARISIGVATGVPGLTVTRDGAIVPAASWGLPVPVDPGDHEIRADAAGYESWTRAISVSNEGQTATVGVPALRSMAIAGEAPKPPKPPAPSSAGPSLPSPTPMPTPNVQPLRQAAGPPEQRASAPVAPSARDLREDRSDVGNPRGESGWIDAALGVGYAGVASSNTSDMSNLAFQNTSGGGPTVSLGAGLRLSFLTLGVRARDLAFTNLNVWELDAEGAFHVQVGAADLYLGLRGGYARGSISAATSDGQGTDVDGFNVGTMLGFDSYLNRSWSWGLEVNPELIDVQRPPLPLPAGLNPSTLTAGQQALYEESGLNLALVFGAALHVGIHF
jgi:hypothetical protein